MVKATNLCRLRLAALLLLALPLAAGAALAQGLPSNGLAVAVELDEADVSLDAGNATNVTGTVTNPGTLQGTVTLALTLPEGWTATVDPPSAFSLASGQSVPITLTLTAPAAGLGALTADVLLDATITDAAGRSASAQATLGVTRVDPLPPPPPPPPYDLYASYGILAAGLIVIGLLVHHQLRSERLARERAEAEEARRRAEHEAYLSRETGIGLTLVEGPHRFGSRREVVFRLAVENQTQRERVALVGVAGCPKGWTAASALPRIPLQPRERVVVTFYVNPGDAVPAHEVGHVVFFAKPEEARELDQRVGVDVTAPEVRVPTLDDKPVTAAREPVAPRPVLRK